MKTSQEIKDRKLDIIKYSVIRPEMYAHDHFGVESFFRNILDDITFIDEREADLQIQLNHLDEKGLFSAQGVAGQLLKYFSKTNSVSKETASIYSEISYNLGYLKIDNLLSSKDWDNIYNTIRNQCRSQDWRLKDILSQFGTPSLTIGNVWQQVHCYVCENNKNEWIFFDYWNEYINNFDAEPDNRYRFKANPILRSVRLPSNKFKNGLVYSPYGTKLK